MILMVVFLNLFSFFIYFANLEYAICVMSIKSKAFLWHQIRCVMGILLLVGQQKEKPEIILELFDINKNPRQVIYEIIRWLWKINSSINVANLTAHFSKSLIFNFLLARM